MIFVKRMTKKFGRELSLLFGKRNAYFPTEKKVISFSFDDFPITAFSTGARLLESFGMRGTFYASLGIASTDRSVGRIASQEQMLSLSKNGHELACHTFSHLDCAFKGHEQIRYDCIRNQNTAKEKANITFKSFAYPSGGFDPMSKYTISKLYSTARTTVQGINMKKIDLFALKSVSLYDGYDPNSAFKWIEILDKNGGWIIFNTHDVSRAPSIYGCSIKFFERILEEASRKEFIVLPVCEAGSIAKNSIKYNENL